MNELQKQMRERWDAKGKDYDQKSAHGIHSAESRRQWEQLFLEWYRVGT